MAYVSKEDKAKLAPLVKAVLKKYDMKGTISVRNHSSLVVKLTKGPIGFGSNDATVNEHWIDRNYEGKAREFLSELVVAMKGPDFFDRSDSQSDYFHCSHYIDIHIGYDKPYALTA
jgi:hypothetical protein